MKQYLVTGMSCAACSARVEKAVNQLPGVTACSVSLLTNSMGVEGEVSADAVIKAVLDAGYGASLKESGVEKKKVDYAAQDEFLKDKKKKKTVIIKEEKVMEKMMKIEGMMCPHCEGRVKKILEEMPQVTEAFVSHVEGMAVVKLSEAVDNDVLKKIIEDQGYKVLDIQ